MIALKIHRPNEQDYLIELDSIQREIVYWSWHLEHGCQRIYSLIVRDLKEREQLLQEALRKPALMPLSKELRNPFNLPPTPDEEEFLKIGRMCLGGLKETASVD